MKDKTTPQDIARLGRNLADGLPATAGMAMDVQPGELLQLAIEKGIGVEGLERLVALSERVADRRAAHEFALALAEFQEECPAITKESTAEIATRGGSRYKYKFASLDHVADTVRPILKHCGFSYSWDSRCEGQMLTCICTLRHEGGHSAKATFQCPTESSAGMSAQQKVASALSFARRQSLIQVLGLTTTEPDDDGVSIEKISDKDLANLRALIDETKASEDKLMKLLGVKDLADVSVSQYGIAVQSLERKRRGV